MKKKPKNAPFVHPGIIRYFRAIFLMAMSLCFISLHSNGQGTAPKVNLSLSSATLRQAMDQFHEQTAYKFVYNNNEIDDTQVIDLNLRNASVLEALEAMFQPLGITYQMNQNQIILTASQASLQTSKTSNSNALVTGTVKDAFGQAVPGATVVIKGLDQGTITDVQGHYAIEINSGDAVLVFSFVGMISQEIQVGGQNQIDVVLQEDILGLDEIVVIGYGSIKKSEMTSAISSVSNEELTQQSVSSVAEALQGRVAGVNVSSISGEPGAGYTINIRGVGTINSGLEPLYVVDGFPVDNIRDINNNDIESLEILKDASATAIYGSRASNGVILVSTKSGKEGKTEINLASSYGFQQALNLPEMNNAKNYAIARNTALINGGNDPEFSEDQIAQLGEGTNWFDEITRMGEVQDHTLSLSGAKDGYKFYTSINYFDHKGIVKKTDYQRLTLRFNQDYAINKYVKLGTNLNISNIVQHSVHDRSLPRGLTYEAMIVDPITRGRIDRPADPNHPYGDLMGNRYSQFEETLTNNWNPLAHLERQNPEDTRFRVMGNAYLEIKPLKGLSLKSDFGMDVRRDESYEFNPKFYISVVENNVNGDVFRGVSKHNNWVWTNTASYQKEIGEHSLSFVLGMSAERNHNDFFEARKSGLVSNDEEYRYLSSADGTAVADGGEINTSLLSYFGRANYNYKEKYLLSFSLRGDGSSKFAEGNKWGYFPAVSAGWVITKEAFMENMELSWLNSLKLRAGWGQIGNQMIPNAATLSTMGTINTWWYGNNYTLGNPHRIGLGKTPINPGNQELIWETSEQTNIGLDAAFWSYRLSLSVDYYVKYTNDLLLIEPLPMISGYQESPWSNAGEVKNSGLEIVINHKNTLGNFSYSLGASLATLNNEIISIGRGDAITGGEYRDMDDITRSEVGESIGQFYGYVADGIFQNEQDVLAHSSGEGLIQPNAVPGDVRFKDLNGDGVLNNEDKKFIGSPIPDFSYSFNVNLSYKSFDLSMFFQGVSGNEVFNGIKVFTEYGDGYRNLKSDVLGKAWHGEGTSNEHPRLTSRDANQNARISSLYVEDGSYLRLKNMQIGYTLPEEVCKKVKLKKLRVYLSGQNLITWTDYSGIDPELSSDSPLDTGIDYTVYPKSRTYSIGLNASF